MDENTWKRSSFCNMNGCLEVRVDGSIVSIRDSSVPGPVLEFTRTEWAKFIAGVKAGEFDDDTP